MNYFEQRPYKDWSATSILHYYDQHSEGVTFSKLCTNALSDLKTFLEKKPKTKTLPTAAVALENDIKVLRSLKSIQVNQPEPRVQRSTFPGVGIIKKVEGDFINIQYVVGRSSKRSHDEMETNPYLSSPSSSTTNLNPNDILPFDSIANDPCEVNQLFDEEETPAPNPRNIQHTRHKETKLVVNQGKKQYTIHTPSSSTKNSPHRPKLTQSLKKSLREYVYFATSHSKTADLHVQHIYKQEQIRERKNQSLVDLHAFDYINNILVNMPYDGLPKKLWSTDFNQLDIQESQFIDIINYALTSFHLHCRSPDLLLNNHERTYFVEHIIPGLLALSKTSGLIQFRWCEFEMQAIKAINLKDNDYNAKKAPQRFLDALGVMTSSMEMEAVIVEASSSGNSENVGPTIEDTVKILECATSSLVHQQSKYKNASIETFKKLRVFSIHVIKNKITLSSTMLCDRYRWNHIELRSATIPSTWTNRLELLKYFELLATLMTGLHDCEKIERQLNRERLGSLPFDGQSVHEFLGADDDDDDDE